MIEIYAREKGKVFAFTVKDSGTVYDLTDCTVTLLVPGYAARSCTLEDAVNGIVWYTLVENDFKEGTYSCKLEIVNGDSRFVSKQFTLVVK